MATGPSLATVRITGLRQTIAAFRVLEAGIRAELLAELRKPAEVVAESARGKLARYTGISLGTIGPRVSARGSFVTQRARKVTGQRGDFGALQMTHGLIPALEEHEPEIVEAAELALDKLTRETGF